MFASKLTVSEDTKNIKLTDNQRGKLRWNKLKELDESGELSFIKNREQLALACGYTSEQKNSSNVWIYGLVKKGYLTEVLTGFVNGKAEREYHLTGKEPDYDYKNVSRKKKPVAKTAPKDTEPIVPKNLTAPVQVMLEPQTIINIKKGDITVSITGISLDNAIEKLLK